MRNVVSCREAPRAFGVSGVGPVDRKNTINCHQLGLQNRHMHWRNTKNIFNGVVPEVLDLFEDRLAVFMFEFFASVKHGNIHRFTSWTMRRTREQNFLELVSLIARVVHFGLVIFTVTQGRKDPSQLNRSQ